MLRSKGKAEKLSNRLLSDLLLLSTRSICLLFLVNYHLALCAGSRRIRDINARKIGDQLQYLSPSQSQEDFQIFSSNSTLDSSDLDESTWGLAQFRFSNPSDSLPDFSYAGYRSGNTRIPSLADATIVFSPTNDEADRTSEIQAAIDSMAGQPGVILFQAGKYSLSSQSPIRLSSNVVLRGDPSTPSQTVLEISGSPRNLFEIGDPKGSGSLRRTEGMSPISQAYVGVGARSAQVEDASNFKVGQSIVLYRLVTQSWLVAMNMTRLFRHGKPEVWLARGAPVIQEREITSIEGNQIMWEIPLTDSIDVSLAENTAHVIAYQPPPRVQEVGIENMVLIHIPSSSHLVVGTPSILPIRFGASENCWIKNVQASGFIEFSYLMPSSRRITMSDFVVIRDEPTSNGGKGALPLDITLGGSQALLLRGKTVGSQQTASYVVATARLAAGPNVVSGYIATGSTRHMIEPHQRWSTGFLVENSHVGQINMKNRGIMGSGHGWAVGVGVIWHSSATQMTVENPPMSRNFKIDCHLVRNLNELKAGNDEFKTMNSLYQLQLTSRIGAEAARDIFERPPDVGVVGDPSLGQAQAKLPTDSDVKLEPPSPSIAESNLPS